MGGSKLLARVRAPVLATKPLAKCTTPGQDGLAARLLAGLSTLRPVGLVEEFSDRAIRGGRLTLFQARDALQIVRAAQERGIIVYGLDAFIAWKDGIEPFQEHMLDTEQVDNPWRAASEFLAEYRDTSFVFEIALDQAFGES